MKDWDSAYREKGILQNQVKGLIKYSVKLFKKRKFKRVLDLGFGTGRHAVFLVKNSFEVHGIDISNHGKKITERRLKNLHMHADLKIGNMANLPYKKDFFDAIVSTHVLNHDLKKNIIRAFDEARRTLKISGIFVLIVPSLKDGHYGIGKEIEKNTFLGVPDVDKDVPHHFFTKKEVIALLHGFKIIKFSEDKGYSRRRKCRKGFFEIIAEKIK